MGNTPSGALAAAAVCAAGLAERLNAFAITLPVPAEIALATARTCRVTAQVSAPRIRSAADVAAIGATLVSALQTLARAAEPGDVARGLYDLAAATRTAAPTSRSPVLTVQFAPARALAASIETAALGEAFLAEARTGFSDRRAASEARERIRRALEASADRVAAALGQAIVDVLSSAAREASAHLVRRATTLQPIVRVQATKSLPATALAWSLYGDPSRAEDLVARNRCGTSLFMPPLIEAVAPGSV